MLLSSTRLDRKEILFRRVNVLHHRLREVKDVPNRFSIAIKGRGAIVGEEDLIGRQHYTSSLIC